MFLYQVAINSTLMSFFSIANSVINRALINLFKLVATTISCLSGQALLESGSALLNIVGLEPKYETITYFICILSSIFLVVAAMLSFIAIFAVKTPKWITLVSIIFTSSLWNCDQLQFGVINHSLQLPVATKKFTVICFQFAVTFAVK